MRLLYLSISGITEAFPNSATVNFEALGPGLIALVGENGVGKSTLIGSVFAALFRQLPGQKRSLFDFCTNLQCVIGKTQQFLAVLRDPNADRAAKAEALEFVIHFVGDMHQPLHDEDNGDKGGNDLHVILDGHPDNLHWVWDTGLVERIDRNPQALAAELERRITDQDRANWVRGSIEDWVMESHTLAQTVAYGDLGTENPAVISPEYERQADVVIEIQLEKAGVRLADLLNHALPRLP